MPRLRELIRAFRPTAAALSGPWTGGDHARMPRSRRVRLRLEILEDRTQPSTCLPSGLEDPPPTCAPCDVEQLCSPPDDEPIAVVGDAVFMQIVPGARPSSVFATDTSAIPFTATAELGTQLYLQYKAQSFGVTFDAAIDPDSIVVGTNLRLEFHSHGHWSLEPTEWTEISFTYAYDASSSSLRVFPVNEPTFTWGTYRLVLDGSATSATPLRSAGDPPTGGLGAAIGTDADHPFGQTFHATMYTQGEDYHPPDDSKYDLAPIAAADLIVILIVPLPGTTIPGDSATSSGPPAANPPTPGAGSPPAPSPSPTVPTTPPAPAPLPTIVPGPATPTVTPRTTSIAPASAPTASTGTAPLQLNLTGFPAAAGAPSGSTHSGPPATASLPASPGVAALALNLSVAPLGGERITSSPAGVAGVERLDLMLSRQELAPPAAESFLQIEWRSLPTWVFAWLGNLLATSATPAVTPETKSMEQEAPPDDMSATNHDADPPSAAAAVAASAATLAVLPAPRKRQARQRVRARTRGRGER